MAVGFPAKENFNKKMRKFSFVFRRLFRENNFVKKKFRDGDGDGRVKKYMLVPHLLKIYFVTGGYCVGVGSVLIFLLIYSMQFIHNLSKIEIF